MYSICSLKVWALQATISHQNDPCPYRGEGQGGAKPTFRIPFFMAWKPWDDDPSNHLKYLKWNINMSFFNKPLALQVELAGSM